MATQPTICTANEDEDEDVMEVDERGGRDGAARFPGPIPNIPLAILAW
jgi:hypothetical protein